MYQICTIPKYQKGIWKKIHLFLWNRKKYNLLENELNSPHLEEQAKYFTVSDRCTIKLDKNKMDSKFIKSRQCSLERSHAVFWLKLMLNSDQDLALSWQKQILTALLVTKVYKNRTMKISLFNYSMLGYISPITTSLPHIYRRNSCPTHIFKPTHQTWLQASSHPGIFQTNLPLFGTFL